MQFRPKSDDELNPVFPPGEYDAEVVKAEEKVSKRSGKEMIEIGLKVYSGEDTIYVKDWLMESVAKKLKQFCKAAGLSELYDLGTLTAEDCKGRSVRVRLKVEASEQYGDQNSVADYPVDTAHSEAVRTPQRQPAGVHYEKPLTQEEIDNAGDDIPF